MNNTDDLINIDDQQIQVKIITLRNKQVMIDKDLAQIYRVENKRLNEQVKRNIERFPESFRFQLTKQEKQQLVANCDRFQPLKHSTALPYAFTEQGVSMLSAVLHSPVAVNRFLIIDNKSVYHFGASLKDLGKKWFAFSKMELDVKDILNKLEAGETDE